MLEWEREEKIVIRWETEFTGRRVQAFTVEYLRATNEKCTSTPGTKDCVSFHTFILDLLGFFRGVLQTVELL